MTPRPGASTADVDTSHDLDEPADSSEREQVKALAPLANKWDRPLPKGNHEGMEDKRDADKG